MMQSQKEPDLVNEHNIPEWKTTARHQGKSQPATARPGIKGRAIEKFERVMPAHRRYCGLSRKIVCFVILAIVIAVLVLIIGLAAGLSSRSKSVSTGFPIA